MPYKPRTETQRQIEVPVIYLVHHADNKAFLLNLIGLYSIIILEDFACISQYARPHKWSSGE